MYSKLTAAITTINEADHDNGDNSIRPATLVNLHKMGFKLIPLSVQSKPGYHVYWSSHKKNLERYVPVNFYNVQCCQVCGFEFCLCKYIVGLDPETGYWIVDDQGELSN